MSDDLAAALGCHSLDAVARRRLSAAGAPWHPAASTRERHYPPPDRALLNWCLCALDCSGYADPRLGRALPVLGAHDRASADQHGGAASHAARHPGLDGTAGAHQTLPAARAPRALVA